MWQFKLMNELKPLELYRIFKLRVDTFVVEQQCYYPEIDEKDLSCVHVYLPDGDKIKAYGRLIIDEDVIHIGRVIVNSEYRGEGLGRELMDVMLEYIQTHYFFHQMHLQGQAHLEEFYGSFKFKRVSNTYFEDFIPHIDMEREAFGEKHVLKG